MCCFEWFGIAFTVFFTAKVLYNLWHFAYTTFLGSALGASIDLRTCGPWAVVTGATDGIGKAYAFKAASKGLNVVLVSRNPEKLRNVSQEIEKMYTSVRTKTIAVDFTEADSTYTKLRSELAGLEVGLLINNVGMLPALDYFYNTTTNNNNICRDVINCNIMSVARTTDIVLPVMVSRKKGVIINVSSLSVAFPVPLFTLYGASKAFIDKFSSDLTIECQKHGIVVQTVIPGMVITNMVRGASQSIWAPLPNEYVDAAVRTLGLEKRTAGYWVHKVLLYWCEVGSFFVTRFMEQKCLQMMEEAYAAQQSTTKSKEQ